MMKIIAYSTLAVGFALVLTGCTTTPVGPHVEVLPAQGKPFETFMEDEQTCRSYAQNSIVRSRYEPASHSFAGATAGALSGGQASTASGGSAGLAAGSMLGVETSPNSSEDAQQRYDIAYAKCMYAKGNQIPGSSQPLQ
ncbi:glycine zipper family protein [Sideroxydans lithotrophicus]|uniref:Glycine-zipper-containing OmpA-like membrane domain-containing protein n=1 Tax=Sideroxydans lithotrophicus (strain ES-1) TaxID=580332 RepID=D5CS72_SIDLE|nr:glycine zipper family protein [Sideroxydans lithotrophicus]ADE11808.1 conserved hypothetical protein [Sideroxydans lithotrophicus ES-1]